MNFTRATLNDIPAVLALHHRYHVATVDPNDKADGFVTTAFTQEELTALINQEQGLFLAFDGDKLVGYIMAASWSFWQAWPMFAYMIDKLPGKVHQGVAITKENSYQYGPICIDKAYRNSGLFSQFFEFALEKMAARFEVLITFVNQINPRSLNAHRNKARLEVLSEFEYNNNHYFELCCLTHR